jgi:hypothetical protein
MEVDAMKYLLLIYTPEPTERPPDDVIAEVMNAYNAFTDHVRQRGAYLAGEALQPTVTATTVRVRNGETLTTDGPFAETKEALGGFYMVEAADLDEAIDFAARIPGAKDGSIEVRPIVDFEALGDPAAAASAAAN